MADIKLIIDVDDDGKIQKATDSLEKLEVAAKKTGANASDMATAFSPSGNLQRNTFSFKDTVDDTTGSLGMMFEQMAGGAAPQDAFIDFVAGLGSSLGPIGAIMIPAVTAGLVALGPKIIEHTGLFKDFGASVEKAAAGIDSVISSFENYQSLTGGDVDLGREVSAFAQRSLQYDVAVASKDATKVMEGLFGHMESLVKRYEFAGAESSRGPEEAARLESMKVALKYLSEVDEVDTSSVKDMVDTLKTVNVVLEQQLEGSLNLDKKKIEKLREFGDSITEFLASVEMNQAKLDAALGYGVDESATVVRDRTGLVRRRNGKTAKDPLKAWFEAQGIRSAPFITAPRYGGDFAANEFWASHDAPSDDYVTKGYAAHDAEEALKMWFKAQGIRSAPFISAPRYGGDFGRNEFWASHDASSDDWKERRREDLVQLGADQLKAFFESQGIRSAPFISAPRYGGNFAANEFWASHGAPSDDYVTKGYAANDVKMGVEEGLKAFFESHGIRSAPFISAPRYGGNFAANEFWASHDAPSDDYVTKGYAAWDAEETLKQWFKSKGIRSAPFISAPRYGGNFAANEFWASHDAPSDDYVTKGYAANDVKMGVEDGLKAFFESHGIRSAPFLSAPRYGGNFAANEFWASHDAPSDDYVTKGYAELDETLDNIYTLWADLKPMMEDRFYGDRARPEMTPELEDQLYGVLENQWEMVSDVLVRQGSFEEIYQAYASTQDTVLDAIIDLEEAQDNIYTLWADLKPMMEDRFYGDKERPEMTPELEEKLYGLLENQWEMVSDVLVRQGSFEEIYQAYASTQDTILDELVEMGETNDDIYTLWADLKPMLEDRFYGDRERPLMTPELEDELYFLIENQWEMISDVMMRQGTLEEIYQTYASTQDSILDALIELEETNDKATEVEKDLKVAQEANTEALNTNAELLRDFFKSQGVDIRPFSTAPRYGGDFGRNEFWAMHDYPEEEFAVGGVVNRATSFGMTNGRRGVMGEAGPEAILPLRRGADGKLGVSLNGEGGQVVIHQSFNFSANGDDSVKKIIASEAPKIAKITERSIINSRQRGGSIRKVFG